MAATTLTVTFEGEAAERLIELAKASGRTPEWFADFMIREYAAEEMRIVRDINEGLASMKRGEGVPHEEVMAEMESLISAIEEAKKRSRTRAASR